MKKLAAVSYFLFLIFHFSFSQNVGIGTNTPNSKAALEVKATDKGVLFPRLTTSQRNAISNPPNGLQIFNTDERCMNYYDSVYQFWNCYCTACETIVIDISSNACKVDFYNTYAKGSPAKKYLINVATGVTISGCIPGDTALSFSSMAFNAIIIINNHGTIAGSGGRGGNAAIEKGCQPFAGTGAGGGQGGGPAVSTKAGVNISINNHGIVAGGGGGGGGSSGTASSNNTYGGGGGGGAGTVGGPGGNGGGIYVSSPIVGCVGAVSYFGQNGSAGQATTGGPGGAGASGGYTGGNGGIRGQPGQDGLSYIGAVPGGLAGKAIAGGSGNSVNNISGGQSFGVVD